MDQIFDQIWLKFWSSVGIEGLVLQRWKVPIYWTITCVSRRQASSKTTLVQQLQHLMIVISSLLCVCYKNVLTHLSTYILRASSSWSFWKTHIEETGEQRKKESSVKIASGSRWKRDHDYYLHLKGKKHETSICYLDWLFIGDFRHSETMLGQTQLSGDNVSISCLQKFFTFFNMQKLLYFFQDQ